MNGRVVLDTNIIIDLMDGDPVIGDLVASLDSCEIYTSVISRMEILSYPNIRDDEAELLKEFLAKIMIVPLDGYVERAAISIRRQARCKLPDAIVAASALVMGATLITRDKALARISFPGLVIVDPELKD